MVDGVELAPFDETEEMRELHGHDPLRLQNRANPGYEVVQVGNVRKDVVRDHEISHLACLNHLLRQLLTEEPDARGHATFLRSPGHVRRRLNSKHWNPDFSDVLQEISIVRCELYDQ